MKITYELIKSFNPCYDPEKIGIIKDYEATIPQFITEYRNKVINRSDIIWVVCRKEFMNEKNIKLFAIWCVRQVQHLMKDQRSINALNIAERFLNNKCTIEVLRTAEAVARAAAADVTWSAWSADYAAYAVAYATYDAYAAAAYATAYATAYAADAYAAAYAAARAAAYAAVAARADAAAAYADAEAEVARVYADARTVAVNKQVDKLLDFFIVQEKGLDYDWS